MKRKIFAPLIFVALGALLPGIGAFAVEEDSLIVPGKRVGVVKLGMTASEVKRDMGNIDGTYELPQGVRLDFAQWKEPAETYKIRLFYKGGKVVQVSESAPLPATADGVSCRSGLDEVQSKYKGLVCLPFVGPAGRINYWLDQKRGIAFAFVCNQASEASSKVSEAAGKNSGAVENTSDSTGKGADKVFDADSRVSTATGKTSDAVDNVSKSAGKNSELSSVPDSQPAKNAQRLSAIVVFPANGRLIPDKDEQEAKVR